MSIKIFNENEGDAMLKILEAPHPMLNTVCEPCVPGDKSLLHTAKQMAKMMYANNGCGLAAPQVGLNARLIVIDVDYDGKNNSTKNPIFLVNPKIEELQGDPVVDEEGCLSCPGVGIPVKRQPWVRVSYFDLDGEQWEIEGDDLLGRCLQHEIDHLEGKTLFESCEPEVKIRALQAYDQAREIGAKPGDVTIKVQ